MEQAKKRDERRKRKEEFAWKRPENCETDDQLSRSRRWWGRLFCCHGRGVRGVRLFLDDLDIAVAEAAHRELIKRPCRCAIAAKSADGRMTHELFRDISDRPHPNQAPWRIFCRAVCRHV
jgi:hypothetical protein